MKVAYLVLSHRPPAQLRRLLTTLRRQDADAPLIVHHDRFRSDVDRSDVDVGGRVELLTSDHPIVWGDFTQVELYWRMLAWMTTHVDFDWVVLLSAQDYPIKPLRVLYERLERTDGDAIVSGTPIEEVSDPDVRADLRRRYYFQYARPVDRRILAHLPHGTQTALRRAVSLGADVVNRLQPYAHVYKFAEPKGYRIGVRARTTPFSAAAPCWYGSSWATLSRRAAETIVRFTREHESYTHYYRATVMADESATVTILCNDPSTRVVPGELHHVRWTNRSSGHPDVFGAPDFDELMRSDRQFARKFDIDLDATILDQLDDLIGRDEGNLGTSALHGRLLDDDRDHSPEVGD